MTVIPSPTNETTSNSLSGSGTNAIGALLSLNNSNGGRGDNYSRYQKLLTSLAVAERLAKRHDMLRQVFQGQWNAENQRWQDPGGWRSWALGWLYNLSHVPFWVPPDAVMLQKFLDSEVLVETTTKSDIVNITMRNGNAMLAQKILYLVHLEANNVLRDQVARRAEEEAGYLRTKLNQVNVEDYRETLLTLLASQEKTLMLTANTNSFAAQMVSPPTVTPTPIWPRPLLIPLVAIIVGALVGIIFSVCFGAKWWRVLVTRFPRFIGNQHGKEVSPT
jgi:hypothetical protein